MVSHETDASVRHRTLSLGENNSLQNRKRVFANSTSDRGIIYKIYKELKKMYIMKINNPIKNVYMSTQNSQ